MAELKKIAAEEEIELGALNGTADTTAAESGMTFNEEVEQ